ncbi:MAG: hypothetical protein L3J37_12790 [Rhodobacteraceae bacterium]|nr:hypothetical protein [Paracoccaceae bacterium]
MKRMIIWGAVAGIGVLGYWYIGSFLKVDACLDAGGRWDYEIKECERGDNG